MLNTVIDSLLVTWAVASLVLLLQFVWYAIRVWQETSLKEVSARITFFNGLLIHHVGNVILVSWFWWKLHQGEIYMVNNPTDAWLILSGMLIAITGILYKIKVFSYSGWETAITVIATGCLSIMSALALYRNH